MNDLNKVDFLSNENINTVELLKTFVNLNPIGTLLVDKEFKVRYINDTLIEYFDNNVELTQEKIGNTLNCKYIKTPESFCGTKRQCAHCIIRNSMKSALKFNRTIKNVQLKKSFVIKDVEMVKWFDMTITPLKIGNETLLWVSLVDLTEYMKYKIEFEMNTLLGSEESMLEKSKFHDNAICHLQSFNNSATENETYFVLFELNDIKDIQSKFGSLWKNDYSNSVYRFINKQIEGIGTVCNYSSSQFLMLIEDINISDFLKLIELIRQFQYSHFNLKLNLSVKTSKIALNSKTSRDVIKEDDIYLEYFRMLTLLEELEDDEIILCTI